MKTTTSRYSSFRSQLLSEQESLTQRIQRIDETLRALDGLGDGEPVRRRGRPPGRPAKAAKAVKAAKVPAGRKRAGSKRAINELSLKEAILKAMSKGPLTKPEIFDGIKQLGYKFSASKPMNSINVQLYTKGQFKKLPGKRFAPAK